MPVTPKSGIPWNFCIILVYSSLTYGMFVVGVRVQIYADIVIFGATAPRPFVDLSPEKDAED